MNGGCLFRRRPTWSACIFALHNVGTNDAPVSVRRTGAHRTLVDELQRHARVSNNSYECGKVILGVDWKLCYCYKYGRVRVRSIRYIRVSRILQGYEIIVAPTLIVPRYLARLTRCDLVINTYDFPRGNDLAIVHRSTFVL